VVGAVCAFCRVGGIMVECVVDELDDEEGDEKMEVDRDRGCGLIFFAAPCPCPWGRVCIEAFCTGIGIPNGESREGGLRKFSTEIRRDSLLICGGAGVESPSGRERGG